IPPPSGDFVGRIDEIRSAMAHMDRAVSSGMATLYGLYGMGGIGKTELACKIAQEVKTLFPGGNLLLNLRGVHQSNGSHEQPLTTTQALQHIIRKFEPDAKLPDDMDELGNRYRSVLAQRRILILADDARDQEQVSPLIPPVGCALLVTSRRRIRLK